LFKLCLFT